MNLLELYLFLIIFNLSQGHSSIYLQISVKTYDVMPL